jgi:ligand-binding SRPBCC domain-containing protein
MSVHRFSTTQVLPLSLEAAWEFFSTPRNLTRITPPEMNFRIVTPDLPDKTYAGQIIAYTLTPVAGIRAGWITEITHVKAPHFFVDEQRKGPYRMWHHQHHFKEKEGGVEMTDIVHYKLPIWFLGDIANSLFVKKQLQQIFDYRFKKVEEMFGNVAIV